MENIILHVYYTGEKEKVYKMIRDNRIKYFAPADYSEGSELDLLIKDIIERTAKNERLERSHYSMKAEAGVHCKKEEI